MCVLGALLMSPMQSNMQLQFHETAGESLQMVGTGKLFPMAQHAWIERLLQG